MEIGDIVSYKRQNGLIRYGIIAKTYLSEAAFVGVIILDTTNPEGPAWSYVGRYKKGLTVLESYNGTG